ncbi:MAG: hypothetical protein KIY10_09295 [Thermoplasmata archaeon]|jgi:hypothetical protein|nr:hypothetical protein [Candidatus Sysuiplasma jiujiangense]MBX8642756.1 hypothetical protein [Candidatus Sysuiplasma jiujiangense]
MRPIVLVLGVLLVIYVIAEWINGTLQYSFEGYIGSGVYGIASYFTTSMPRYNTFMTLVYVFTFLIGIGMVWVGLSGEKK